MALNISAGAIRNPIPPIVLFLALLFAGATAYFRLPINQLPNIEFPAFSVTVTQAGAAPAELETQISQRVEAALTSVEGVKRIDSTLSQGQSLTVVELQLGTDISRAVDDARDAIQRIRTELPADIDEPVIERQDSAAEPIAYYAVEAQGQNEQDISWFIDNRLNRDLLAVPGVSAVTRLGGVDREIRVQLDPQRLLAFGITADEVSSQLVSANIDLPGGRAQVGGQAQTIRTLGGAESVEALAGSRIVLPDGRSVRLEELGAVIDGASELTTIARYNGQAAIGFMVQRSKGTSEVKVYDEMEAKIQAIEKANPGVKFRLISSPVDFIKGMHESSIHALLEGAILAVIVVLVILRDWRATVISAFAIPLAVIPTFAFMEPMNFTLNMITLIALSLVAGVLVDDAIVEIENIVRHMRMGKTPYQAAIEAADEIGLAVVATSATIIAVFLPVSFMSGTTGQFFKEFGITVAVAVFLSLLVARLITPMMAAHFLRPHAHEEKPGRLRFYYEKVLRWAIDNPWRTLVAGLGVFIVSMLLAFQLPFTFIPRLDNGAIQMEVELPPGMPLMEADRKLRELTKEMDQIEEVEGVFTSIDGVDGAATSASVTVQLVDRKKRERSSYEVQQALRPMVENASDVRISFQNFQGGSRGSDITLEFVGDDAAAVTRAADALVAQMKGIDTLADAKSSASLKRPELQIRPYPDEAARLGVSASALASAVRIATSGDVDQNLAKYNLPDRQVPIRVLLRPDARADIDTIRSLTVRTQTGESVRLDSVASVEFGVGEAEIERRDRQRKVTVSANVIKGVIGPSSDAVYALPAARTAAEGGQMPPGVRLLASGDTENSSEFAGSFIMAMIWGLILIYGVLVLLFKDFFQPITILTAFPLSIGGAVLGLLLTNQPMSLFVGIGLIMLMGIVTKNSILLVDFTIESMKAGMTRAEALFEAGSKRARPIIMTTIAMSAGMIPAAAGWGVDGSLRQGMGAAVIGGLLLSTLLSLIFVPAVFVLISRLEGLITPMFARFSSTHETGEGRAPSHAKTPVQPAE